MAKSALANFRELEADCYMTEIIRLFTAFTYCFVDGCGSGQLIAYFHCNWLSNRSIHTSEEKGAVCQTFLVYVYADELGRRD